MKIDNLIIHNWQYTFAVLLSYFSQRGQPDDVPSVSKIENSSLLETTDEETISRISKSYLRAKRDQLSAPSTYLPSPRWQKELNAKFKSTAAAIINNDIMYLKSHLPTFLKNKLSFGFGGGSEYFNVNTKPIHKYAYANTWSTFLRCFREEYPAAPLLEWSPVGCPIGIRYRGYLLPLHAIRCLLIAQRLIHFNLPSPATYCEIGGGLGQQAYATAISANLPCTYVDFDLPELLFTASYFLLESLPEKRIMLYGEDSLDNIKNYDIALLPNFTLPFITDNTSDLFFNYSSFPEIEPDILEEYYRQLCRILKPNGLLLHINHGCGTPIEMPQVFRPVYTKHWALTTWTEKIAYKSSPFKEHLLTLRE